MRTLLVSVAVVAVANLVGLLGFAGWLVGSGRLDAQRLQHVRSMFAETIQDQRSRESDEAAAEVSLALAAEQARKDARPPMTATEQLAARVEATEIDRQRAERLRREVADLQRGLEQREAELERQRRVLARERDEFERMRQDIVSQTTSEQFKKALATMEGLKPADAKKAFKEIIDGDPSGGVGQVVSYLNAMDDRIRTKIVTEFIKEDSKLAAELLERMRMRGSVVSPSVESVADGSDTAPR